MTKSPPRLHRLRELSFAPRFAYGDQAQAVQVCGADDLSELGAGYGRLTQARFPWTIKYDEMILVLEGSLTVHTATGALTAEAGDSVWLPAGTDLEYEAEEALIFYAIHPADWASR
ncbi:MAG: cupin domain-containing protein [Pseudomonadota bacterium]